MTIQLYIKKEVLPYQTLCVSFENQIVPLEQINGYWTITIPNHPKIYNSIKDEIKRINKNITVARNFFEN